MGELPDVDQAARALADVRRRQQQVIDLANIPNWYWWVVGGLTVVLAAGVDARRGLILGAAVSVFVVGMVATTLYVTVRPARRAQLRNGIVDIRGVLAILSFVALVIAVTLGIAFPLQAAGVPMPATVGCLAGALVMGIGGPLLMRFLRKVMLDNRAGSPR
jgi:uncharacterized membrane protein YkvI